MANKYENSYAVLLNNGKDQILPVSKAQLIELAYNSKVYFNNVDSVQDALTYLVNSYIPDEIAAAKLFTTQSINDLGDGTAQTEAGKAIVSVTQTNGVVTASAGNINSDYVEVTNGTTNYGSNGGTVSGALSYLKSELDDARNDGEITVTRSTSDSSYAAVYTISQGGSQVGDAINIPLDLVATEGTLVNSRPRTTEDGEGSGDITGTYISMSISHGTPFYIDVKDLIEYNNFSDSTEIDFTDDNHTITAEIKTIASSKITYNNSTVEAALTTLNTLVGDTSVETQINDKVATLSYTIDAKEENGFTYVLTGLSETDGIIGDQSYVALTDTTVKTTPFESTDKLYQLLGDNVEDTDNINTITDVHSALNAIAGKVKATQGEGVTEVVGDENNTYINVSASKSGNSVTLTVDESALGNVAKLQYDELTGWDKNEVVTLYGANPTV